MADLDTPPSKDDVLAILKAHRDLGPEYDNHLADQIMDLWKRPGTRGKSEPALAPDMDAAARFERRRERHGMARSMPFLGISIPLLAIAGGEAHTTGVLAVLALDALVLVVNAIRG